MIGQGMGDSEHLARLRRGVQAWNKWRAAHPRDIPWLMGADLSGIDLACAELSQARLDNANLNGADLSGARLTGTSLVQASLTRASLASADLRWADLSEAQLTEARLEVANLRSADLRKAVLIRASLYRTNLGNANMSGADLTEADFREADLGDTNFSGAKLLSSNFSGASISRTIFGANDLSVAIGLESVRHIGPSVVGTDTVFRSKGKIPESFLRDCGVPNDFIIYMTSLRGPMEFHSCFISYSTWDQNFVESLYAGLQEEGVRCWFAPEDLKIGDRFQERIEESIRACDKLLVVLSKRSVESAWVEREVQAAFEKERKHRTSVLLPVRLDNAVMDCPRAWAAEVRRTRHIGDFRKWKDHDSFQKSLDRLLRDLKSQDSNPK